MVEQREQEQEPARELPQAPGWALFPRRATGWGRRCRPLLATAVLRVLTLLAGPKWWLGAGAVVVALVARRGDSDSEVPALSVEEIGLCP